MSDDPNSSNTHMNNFGGKVNTLRASDFLIGILLVAVAVMWLYRGKAFSSKSECIEYVKKTSQTNEKMIVGTAACNWTFVDQTGMTAHDRIRYDVSKCILSNIDSITDDQSGTKVVTDCANSHNAGEFGRAFARYYFSPTARMERLLEEQRQALEDQQIQMERAANARQQELIDRADLNDRINRLTCTRIGGTLECF